MPDAEIHLDFDRDGRLSLTATEYAARSVFPGAILGVNADRDGRALPSTPRVGSAIALDHTMPVKSGHDGDPVPLTLVVSAAAIANFTALRLRITGDNAEGVGLLDARSRVVPASLTQPRTIEFPLGVTAGRHSFKLEARRVPGSPLGASDGALEISVVGRNAAGNEVALDHGLLRLAPFIVLDDLSPAQLLYMCRLPDNEPSVRDVRAALARISPSVTLRLVEPADSAGDAWMQDQFQLGYVLTPSGTTRTILHMPRFRKNAQVGPTQRNLAELVRTHFPSTNLALIDDFWQRQLTVPNQGAAAQISFAVSEEAFRVLHRVEITETFLRSVIRRLCSEARRQAISPAPRQCTSVPLQSESLPIRRNQIPTLLTLVEGLVTTLLPHVTFSQEGTLRAVRDRARALVQEVDRGLRIINDDLFDLTLSVGTFRMDGGDVIGLHGDVKRMHDSLVYGGNVEATPAFASFPFGKVLIGEGEERQLDLNVLTFFQANSDVQPLVVIDTQWLSVGHVDELVTFLPNRRESGQHVILRSSPSMAQALFDAIRQLYVSGLSDHHPDRFDVWRPLTIARHDMNNGTHPVTRMFRGKYWVHSHPPPQQSPQGVQSSGEISEPPHIYLEMVDWFGGLFTDTLAPYYADAPNADTHYYKAAMTTWELEFFEGTTNEEIAEQKLGPLDKTLRSEFPGFPIFRLPVKFDRADPLGVGSTAAFTPNLVNLQYLNGRVIIPDPFGPRMQPADAVTVIQRVLRDQGLGSIAAGVSTRFFTRHQLDVVRIWINRLVDGGSFAGPITTARDLAREFRDGFARGRPEDEIEGEIRRANRTAFDGSGRLRDGWWHLTIPERTVDIFQAFTHAILASLDVDVAWIDSWFYHVRFGEIHCGTNVIRQVPRVRTNWWSRIPPP